MAFFWQKYPMHLQRDMMTYVGNLGWNFHWEVEGSFRENAWMIGWPFSVYIPVNIFKAIGQEFWDRLYLAERCFLVGFPALTRRQANPIIISELCLLTHRYKTSTSAKQQQQQHLIIFLQKRQQLRLKNIRKNICVKSVVDMSKTFKRTRLKHTERTDK